MRHWFYNRRRKHSPIPIQLKYSIILTLVMGFITLLLIFIMAWFIQRNYNLFMTDELGLSTEVIHIIRREQKLLQTWLLITFFLSILTIFGTAFYIIRRLTGPMAAVQRHLALLINGEWERRFKLRKNDEFKELEFLLNELRKNYLNSQKENH